MPDRDAHPPVLPESRRRSAWDAITAIAVVAFVLLVAQGQSVTSGANEMQPGPERSILLAIGKPTGWIAAQLPFADKTKDETPPPVTAGNGAITAASFDARALGEPAPKLPKLTNLLVTGDSLSMPLDQILTRRLAGRGVKTDRQPHIGTGISKTDLLDWTVESAKQAKKKPQAVVIFIGANEGFPLKTPKGPSADCCTPDWAAAYANRVRTMMQTYLTSKDVRVYWLLVMAPRDPDRQKIARAVNAAVRVAGANYGSQVRVLDMPAIFTPDGKYRDAISVDGKQKLVRRPDGIHLNDDGAEIAADAVMKNLEQDFGS